MNASTLNPQFKRFLSLFKKFSLVLGVAALCTFLFGTFFAELVDAQTIPKPDFLPGPDEELSGSGTQDYVLNVTIPRALNIIIGVMGLTSFVGLLVGAIILLTAYGNDDKVNKGKTVLQYSILGFMTVLFAYAIVSIVVAISLPSADDGANPDTSQNVEGDTGGATDTGGDTTFLEYLVPSAHAVDADDSIILFPSQQDIIENQETIAPVQLPSGDLITEIVPAAVANVMFFAAFLVFIALTYGGAMMVLKRGNEEALTKAKSIVVWSAVALGTMSMGYAIIYGIATISFNDDPTTDADEVFNTTDINEDF